MKSVALQHFLNLTYLRINVFSNYTHTHTTSSILAKFFHWKEANITFSSIGNSFDCCYKCLVGLPFLIYIYIYCIYQYQCYNNYCFGMSLSHEYRKTIVQIIYSITLVSFITIWTSKSKLLVYQITCNIYYLGLLSYLLKIIHLLKTKPKQMQMKSTS